MNCQATSGKGEPIIEHSKERDLTNESELGSVSCQERDDGFRILVFLLRARRNFRDVLHTAAIERIKNSRGSEQTARHRCSSFSSSLIQSGDNNRCNRIRILQGVLLVLLWPTPTSSLLTAKQRLSVPLYRMPMSHPKAEPTYSVSETSRAKKLALLATTAQCER